MTAPVLVCTVGGSAQPIISAIRAAAPIFVRFVVTLDSTNTDGKPQPGSYRQLEGPDSIPALTGLDTTRFDRLIVPPDQPDIAFAVVAETLRALRVRFPELPIIADYTGGTKSMSAALLAAALGIAGVELQFMAGDRLDLVRVASGSERPFHIVPDFLLIGRQAALLRQAWQTFGYAEAADGFRDLEKRLAARPDAPPDLARRISDLATLSEGFAAWDRFEHAAARNALTVLLPRHTAFLAPWCATLDAVLLSPQPTPNLLLDLWRNAERRAARGQFDDAVARCYRLLEWTGQWLLGTRHGIDTGKVPWEKLRPEDLDAVGIAPRPGQKDLGGLVATLRYLARIEPGSSIDCFLTAPVPGKKNRPGLNELRNMLDLRNPSILAHGHRPLTRADWDRFNVFMTTAFFPAVLHPELSSVGVPTDPPQLPCEPPVDL